ncbi:hypothetical protein Bca101_098635 [Brassica carinata]
MFIYVSRDLRPATCDLRPIAGRMLRDNETNNNMRPAISRKSHVAGRRSQVARHVNEHGQQQRS